VGLLEAATRILHGLGYQTDVVELAAIFGLALARVSTALSLSPFLGGKSVANPVKLGLSVLFTVFVFPSAAESAGELNPVLYMALLLKEAMIGLTIAFVAQLLFYALQTAGALIDTGRGMDQPGLFVPQLPGNASVLAQLKMQAAIVLFLALNGHLIYLRALGRSFRQLPLLRFPAFGATPLGTAQQMARISSEVFLVAIQLAAPVMIALFLVDVCFGVLGKMAPQMHVHQESQPVKSLIGIAVLLAASGFIFVRIEGAISRMFWNLYTTLAGMS
jgi:flagellar biosynthetic protein FliR